MWIHSCLQFQRETNKIHSSIAAVTNKSGDVAFDVFLLSVSICHANNTAVQISWYSAYIYFLFVLFGDREIGHVAA